MTSGWTDVPKAIAAAAEEAARWDAQSGGFSELSDAALLATRDVLIRLVDHLEALVAAAEAESTVDETLVGLARRALRTARHNEVWAGYVLHQRLPPTDLSQLE
jgi:hypothetical protein